MAKSTDYINNDIELIDGVFLANEANSQIIDVKGLVVLRVWLPSGLDFTNVKLQAAFENSPAPTFYDVKSPNGFGVSLIYEPTHPGTYTFKIDDTIGLKRIRLLGDVAPSAAQAVNFKLGLIPR